MLHTNTVATGWMGSSSEWMLVFSFREESIIANDIDLSRLGNDTQTKSSLIYIIFRPYL